MGRTTPAGEAAAPGPVRCRQVRCSRARHGQEKYSAVSNARPWRGHAPLANRASTTAQHRALGEEEKPGIGEAGPAFARRGSSRFNPPRCAPRCSGPREDETPTVRRPPPGLEPAAQRRQKRAPKTGQKRDTHRPTVKIGASPSACPFRASRTFCNLPGNCLWWAEVREHASLQGYRRFPTALIRRSVNGDDARGASAAMPGSATTISSKGSRTWLTR